MAVTGIGSGLSLNATLQTYYKKTALDNLEANLYFQQLAKHDTIPANNGTTWNTYRYDKIASSTTAITEGAAPAETVLSATTTAVSLSQYGQWVKISDLAMAAHRTTVVPDAIKELSYTGAKSIDEVVRAELIASATNYFANGQSALSTVGSTDTLDAEDIREITTKFAADDVRPFDGNDFVGVFHPFQMHDLRGDTAAGGFLDINKYNQSGPMLNGEIGKMWNMRLLETSQVTSVTAGTESNAAVYGGFAMGANAIADVDLASMPFEVFVKGLGSSGAATDPLNQIASVGYKFTYGALYLGGDATSGRARYVRSGVSFTG